MLFFPIIYNNFMVWYPASTSDWTGSDPSVLFNGMLAHVRYVKIYLETDKAHASKKRTSVKRNTTDPVYNEVLQRQQRASGGSLSYLFSMLSFTKYTMKWATPPDLRFHSDFTALCTGLQERNSLTLNI